MEKSIKILYLIRMTKKDNIKHIIIQSIKVSIKIKIKLNKNNRSYFPKKAYLAREF